MSLERLSAADRHSSALSFPLSGSVLFFQSKLSLPPHILMFDFFGGLARVSFRLLGGGMLLYCISVVILLPIAGWTGGPFLLLSGRLWPSLAFSRLLALPLDTFKDHDNDDDDDDGNDDQ